MLKRGQGRKRERNRESKKGKEREGESERECVCVRERERERGGKRGCFSDKYHFGLSHFLNVWELLAKQSSVFIVTAK